jgi:uncharacterized protein YjiK
VDERVRNIISFAPGQPIEIHKPKYEEYIQKIGYSPFTGARNAGLEAITCDPETNSLYIFNERQMRMALRVDPKTWHIDQHFDAPAGMELPKTFFFEKDGKKRSYVAFPDFAGASWYKGHLYVLVRNDYLVLKIDPKTHAVLDRVDFKSSLANKYDDPLPFGIAEGLVVSDKEINIIVDNNGAVLHETGKPHALWLTFDRPNNF